MEFQELLKKWGDHMMILRGMKPLSVGKYGAYITEFFKWYGKKNGKTYKIGDITRQDIEHFLEYLFYERSNSNYTRKTKLIALRSFWQWLLYAEQVPKDITHLLPTPIVRQKLLQTYTKEDILRIFRQIDIHTAKGLRDSVIFILLAFTGLRIGELISLRIGDLSDDGDHIRVQITEDIGKKGSSRVVDLWKAPSIFVRQWLSLRLSCGAGVGSSLLCSVTLQDVLTGRALGKEQVGALIKKYARAAGIRKAQITSHMFRATHASDLRHIRGYDIAAIAERLGHRNIATTDRYLPSRDRLKKEYKSLRQYWIDWEKIWIGEADGQK